MAGFHRKFSSQLCMELFLIDTLRGLLISNAHRN